MRKIVIKIIKCILLSGVAVLFFLLLYPRTYNVPVFKERNATQYWNLKTGSKIGYIYIKAEGIKKSSPIIFLQGGPGGPISDNNIEVLSELAKKGYDVYLYDQLGCGNSN